MNRPVLLRRGGREGGGDVEHVAGGIFAVPADAPAPPPRGQMPRAAGARA